MTGELDARIFLPFVNGVWPGRRRFMKKTVASGACSPI